MGNELMELPEGWKIVQVGDVIELQYGKSLTKSSRDGGNYNVYGSKGIVGSHSSFLIEKPCLIVGRKGSIGEINLSQKACWPIDTTYYIDEFYGQPIKFWFYLLKALSLSKLDRASAIPGLNREDVYKLPIALPPLNEQKRIVAKIEALRERSRRAREALFEIPGLCDRFRQSVLAAAFRGDLTADWRKQNPDIEPAPFLLKRTSEQLKLNFDELSKKSNKEILIPDTWTWAKLKQFIKRIKAGKNFICPEIPVNEDTVGLVKISAVTWGKFDPKETKTVADISKIEPDLFIKKGDFLISRANTIELVGASVVVEEINYKIMLSDKVWRVDFIEVNKKFINFYLKSIYGRKEIESRATGNQLSMRNISQEAFRDIVIPIPPLKEQWEIVRQIEVFFKAIDQIEQQYQEAKAQLDQLDQSILAKAFRGELVPQDPNDEPASVLLERIKAEREQLGEKKKTTRKSPAPRSRKAKTQTPTFEQMTLPGLDLEATVDFD